MSEPFIIDAHAQNGRDDAVLMEREVPAGKLLFGSDFPWLDPRANLPRVFLAGIPTEAKRRILCDNALEAFRLPV